MVTLAALPRHKTKIICTIGPDCDSPALPARMIGAGMNLARLNFSHRDFDGHREVMVRLRSASEAAGYWRCITDLAAKAVAGAT